MAPAPRRGEPAGVVCHVKKIRCCPIWAQAKQAEEQGKERHNDVRTTRYNTMSTPTSTSSSRKRNADVDDELVSGRKLKIAKPSPSSSPAAHLPASCLAAILNFMEYGEVRRCLLAGKIIAVGAARHVEVLNIMNALELVPSAARRFANVSEINILSLVTPTEDDDEEVLSASTATRSVLFLTAFPKLKHAFLGGLCRDTDDEKWFKFSYTNNSSNDPKDHLAVFRGLVDHLCGAFQSRSLSQSLYLEGVFDSDQLECNESSYHHCRRCRLCWNIVTSFPPALVLKNIPMRSSLCLSYSKRIKALATRHDNPLLSKPREILMKFLLTMINGMLDYVPIFSRLDDGENYPFTERIKYQGGKVNKIGGWTGQGIDEDFENITFFYIPVKDMEALKQLSTIIGPSIMNSIPKRELLSAVRPLGKATEDGKKNVLARQTFESLVQLGLDLASEDFVLVDPLTEDALQKYHRYFHSEEEAS